MQYRPKIFMLNMQKYTGSEIWNNLILLSIMAQLIPSVPFPPPRALSGIGHLVSLGGGEFVRKPLPGDGAFVNSSRSG